MIASNTSFDTLSDDYVNGVWSLRRCLRSGDSTVIRAVGSELSYLAKLYGRAMRPFSQIDGAQPS